MYCYTVGIICFSPEFYFIFGTLSTFFQKYSFYLVFSTFNLMLRSHGTQLACQVCVHMKPTFQHEWKDNLLLLSKTSNVCQRSYCLEFLAPLQHGRHGWCWGGSGLWILLISTKASINKFPCLYVSIQRFSQYGDLHQLLLKPSLIWLSFQRYFHLSITQSHDLLSRISLRR